MVCVCVATLLEHFYLCEVYGDSADWLLDRGCICPKLCNTPYSVCFADHVTTYWRHDSDATEEVSALDAIGCASIAC